MLTFVKRIFLAFILCSLSWNALAQQEMPKEQAAQGAQSKYTNEELWDQANTAYLKEDYVGAKQLYCEILSRGVHSPALYYNLGNVYYQCNELGKSLLFYYKAQKSDPSDANLAHNLALASSRVKDNIEQMPQLFIFKWSESLSSSLSSSVWAVLSLVFLALLLGAAIIYFLFSSLKFKRLGFFSGLIFLFLFLLTTRNAIHEREHLLNPNGAVVMSESLVVRSSPIQSSTELFILHEGTRVEVLERHNEWCEIMIADGKRGWVICKDISSI